MDFSGKYVLVTGGSRGIGRAVAEAFAHHGASVAINYKTNLKAAKKTLESLPGGPHFIIQADIRKPEAVQHLIDEEKGVRPERRFPIFGLSRHYYE
jgi:NAD(P)-dependent dehydrogenase (short-subunit alcohol dehydrogenase family)